MSDCGEPGGRRVRRGWFGAAAKSAFRRYPRALAGAITDRAACSIAEHEACLRHIEDRPFAAAWLGHASVLARLGGATALVDPVLSGRIGLRVGPLVLGPRRLAPAPIAPGGLPRPDVILLTHAHFDHLDRPTLAALAHERTTVITAPGTRRLVPRGFGAVVEMSPERTLDLNRASVRCIEPAHWGARKVVDRRRGVNAYLVASDTGSVLFAGDTAATGAFEGVGPVDLAVFGVGAYDPWEHAHATPEQVWSMFRAVPGRLLLPVHHSTFELSDEHVDEPMERLLRAAGEAAGCVVRVAPGEVWSQGTSGDQGARSAGGGGAARSSASASSSLTGGNDR